MKSDIDMKDFKTVKGWSGVGIVSNRYLYEVDTQDNNGFIKSEVMSRIVKMHKLGYTIAVKKAVIQLDENRRNILDDLHSKYVNFEPLVAVPGNFLEDVLMKTKEILNHINEDENDVVNQGLTQMVSFFSKDESGVVKTSELISMLDFLRLPNDHCT